jgi:DNA-binding response OmpR family regulator
MRALIVEDEDEIARLLKSGLESEYFVVDVAVDGDEGSYLARRMVLQYVQRYEKLGK